MVKLLKIVGKNTLDIIKSYIFGFIKKTTMPYFTIRIDIDSHNRNDYALIEQQLEQLNIFNFIESEDGSRYILPLGEFRLYEEIHLQQVLDKTIIIANRHLKQFKILVTESNGTAWTGLLRIE